MHGDVFHNVIRYRYYQGKAVELVVRVIPSPVYSLQDERMIITEHEKEVWGKMDIVVQCVDRISLTSAGKQRRIISHVAW